MKYVLYWSWIGVVLCPVLHGDRFGGSHPEQPAGTAPPAVAQIQDGSRPSSRTPRDRTKAGDSDRVARLSVKESTALRVKAREAIEQGDWVEAERLIREGDAAADAAERQAWLLVKVDLAYARKQYAKAALEAMRLVILHPQSRSVASGLYWAGRSYEHLKRPGKARELYREAVQHPTCDDVVRKMVSARLAALEKQGEP